MQERILKNSSEDDSISDFSQLAEIIKLWGKELGFQEVRIADADADANADADAGADMAQSERGKHTLLLSREAGSMFFLGEIYTDMPVAVDTPIGNYCGSCTKCIDICPTHAIIASYRLDARRCISYLTIEHKGASPKLCAPDRQPRIRLR
jgi:epoxyqueuosine reductase QueG